MTGGALLALLAPPEVLHDLGWRDAVLLIALLCACGVIAVVDARTRIIPNECNLLVTVLGLVFAAQDGFENAAAAALQGMLSALVFWLFRAGYHAARGRHGLGFGDVKFLGAAGCWVGLAGLAPLILVACMAAFVFLGVQRMRGHSLLSTRAIPFGPFLVVGLVGTLGASLLQPAA